MQTFKRIVFDALILSVALCAFLLPLNSSAQTPPDDSTPSEVPATLPSDILPTSQLAQVIKLAQAGVSQSIILSYVSNSAGSFNLTSDQIIYLKDIGLPDEAVVAMMQRDQQLGGRVSQATSPVANATVSEQPVQVTQNYFYDTLSPYGKWVNVEGYGLCWQPMVMIYDSSWQPYCDHGHWIYTDDGWYWVSDYSWGACVFHYGRWFHDAHLGWCWWPDTVWAPSWVCWRYSNDYCGWAPLPPRTVYHQGVGIIYGGAVISAGFDFGINVNFFTFVPTKDFCDPHPEHFRVPRDHVMAIYRDTTVINNYNINSRDHSMINVGIAPERIAAVTRTPIPRVTIRETSAPEHHGEQLTRDEIVVHRPHFTGDPAVSLHQDVVPRPNRGIRPIAPPPAMNENRNNFNPAPRNPPPQQPQQNNFSQPNNFSPSDRNLPPAQRPPENRPETPRVMYGSPYQQPENASPSVPKVNPPQMRSFQPDNNRAFTPSHQTPTPSQHIAPPAVESRQPEQQQRIAPSENHQVPVTPPVERSQQEQRPNHSGQPQIGAPFTPPAQTQPSVSQQQRQQPSGNQNRGRDRNKDNKDNSGN